MKPMVLSLVLSIALSACAAAKTPDAGPQAAVARDMNRSEAIASARRDASRTYGSGSGPLIDAQYRNGFWVVELLASTGATLHYAISAHDGSIRERAMLQ